MKKRVIRNGIVGSLRQSLFDRTGIYISRGPLYQRNTTPDLSMLLGLVVHSCRRPLSIVQVSGHHSLSFDPLPSFVRSNSHHITHVDPNPQKIHQLKSNYEKNPLAQVIVAAMGQSDHDSTMNLYYFTDQFVYDHADFGNISSGSKAHLQEIFEQNRHRIPGFYDSESVILSIEVPRVSAESVMLHHGSVNLDLLLIDAGGADWEILRQFDFNKVEISIVQIEHRFLDALSKEELLSHMHRHGYRMYEFSEQLLCIKDDSVQDVFTK